MGINQTKISIEKTPIFEVIREEFLSLDQIEPLKISFEQLGMFKIPKNFQGDVDLTRLETLFMLDHDKDGVISIEDVKNFCLVFSNCVRNGPDWDLANRFNHECVQNLTRAISREGSRRIAEWTVSLVSQSGHTIPQESIMLLFRLFAPLTGDSMDSLKFYRLLRRGNDEVNRSTIIEEFLEPFFNCYLVYHETECF